MDNRPSPDEILSRMEQVRSRLGTSASEVRSSAHRLSDWRYYVRRFPWTSAAVAAGIGYLVVPKRQPQQVIDARTLEKLAKDQRVVLTPSGAQPKKRSLTGALTSIVVTSLAQAAMGYVSERLGEMNSTQKQGTSSATRYRA